VLNNKQSLTFYEAGATYLTQYVTRMKERQL